MIRFSGRAGASRPPGRPPERSGWGAGEAHLDCGEVRDESADEWRRLLLRVGDRPVETTWVGGAPLDRERLRTEAGPRCAAPLVPHLVAGQDLPRALLAGDLPPHPLASKRRRVSPAELQVAVCTSRGPDDVGPLLDQLTKVFDVVVEENGSPTPRLTRRCKEAGARHRHHPRPGLSAARNRAMAACSTPWVLFLDDDCRLGRGGAEELAWRLGGAIDRVPEAGAVTGLVLPESLATGAQVDFERYSSHGRGFLPARHHLRSTCDPHWPLRGAWKMGVGACLGVRRRAWESVGGFDQRLGAGTPARGADDDAFLRALVEAGWTVFYDPAVAVHHRHRRTATQLRAQLFGFGLGGSVATLLRALDHRDPGPLGVWLRLLRGTWLERDERGTRLMLPELAGFLGGPAVALRVWAAGARSPRRARRGGGRR